MSSTITYKGETIATASNNTKTLKTAGKYLEDDITVTDTTSSVTLQDKAVTPTESLQTIQADTGYTGLGTVTVDAIPTNYGLITWNGSVLTIT